MRIREMLFHNFRSFRGEHRISFVDPATNAVRPLTVLAGSNGSGKTTVLEAIDALLTFLLDPLVKNDFLQEVQDSGLIALTLEISRNDTEAAPFFPGETARLQVAVGQRSLAPNNLEQAWPNRVIRLTQADSPQLLDHDDGLAMQLRRWVSQPNRTSTAGHLPQPPLPPGQGSGFVSQPHRTSAAGHGGWLYFPYDRRLTATRGGTIEPPADEQRWAFRFELSDTWKGSLEQLWVWQNYLDLERQSKQPGTSPRLPNFVHSVEKIFGGNRRIFIEEGRVRVATPYQVAGEVVSVRLDQLPSGEQQVLLLLGELARRRREGAVIAIDEIENSLHPTLQRLIMWNLSQLAREWDAQVIVTTHSLEVINSVRGSAFINLDYPDDRFNLPVPATPGEAAL